ncbi:CoA transferase [Dasania sp. GY-MA-18]|uniref:CaiB/BaiF CoA-transferase family protein n=1 Tax=Dasania phycosphaerae TaxID=2950436 RepID=A0A9J6RKI5_9GAMM|nr:MULTISPECIES: CaiB/BaiF CoA-transferase family protein [Dasania]MCR8922065.1 CoA transferase [Dasania sp. GY-MA-18]MCZ0864493.1 CaiB/BaiF CoA-transferase family protein [Dasania phycosphaerae]MCZ0868221.1 CaiB/BaiF CoA-transferase family protein [Dasania phycosphaerae]
MSSPLTGYKVLDMSRILAGPWAGQTLADLGADVIKVERPGEGDDTRKWGPPYLSDNEGNPTSESAYYLCANRGKRSLTLDITSAEGQAIIKKLVAESDVLLENYKVGGLKKYGLDYESLSAINPRLVYCSITGFGQHGPYQNRAGYDFMIQGMGGLMSITGEPEGGPLKVGVAVTDIFTGLYATIAIQGALLERERSGLGQHIDMALLDSQVAVLANQASNYLVGGMVPGRLGNAHPNIVPYQAFATSDGFIILAVGNDSQFKNFCELAGRPELADLPQYATNQARVHNRETLCAEVAALLAQRSEAYWLDELTARGIPCGPVNSIDKVMADPQVNARDMRTTVKHPYNDQLQLVGSPMKFSRTPVNTEQAPPLLGEHSAQILAELGYSEAEIAQFKAKGLVS